ncbi:MULTISPECIES: hypothetical protein [unclassified Bacillus (in: firmicutes)]|uniref:hypothetical protein n=1 Tax=unclassified Bacillus (in: firmicutes) TaxID=185979 RepID=UPI0033657823
MVPLVSIGLGVLVSIFMKKIFVAPIITFILNGLYEVWYMRHYDSDSNITFTSWNITFPQSHYY